MGDIHVLPLNGTATNNDEIAKHLEEQAGWIRDGDFGKVLNAIVMIYKEDNTITINTCGYPMNYAERVGHIVIALIREAAKTA